MALRLSRLQREMHEKSDEIRRLQTEILSESDENAALRQKLDDLYRKYRDLEKKNVELVKRLEESQSAEESTGGLDVEVVQMRGQLKKIASEYEVVSQKYCDLNILHEQTISQRDRERKQVKREIILYLKGCPNDFDGFYFLQMKQLQLEVNQVTARCQRDMADVQLLLDSAQTEIMDLKQLLEEKKRWMEVLEDKCRHCSEQHSSEIGARSPKAQQESIGFTLLQLEVGFKQVKLHLNLFI